jgi:phosphoribosylformylglycinamidine synthase subunit PurS
MWTTRCGREPARCWCARNSVATREHDGALHALGFGSVGGVRQGKYIEVEVVETDPGRARAEVERMCEQLLANTIIENYAYELDAA